MEAQRAIVAVLIKEGVIRMGEAPQAVEPPAPQAETPPQPQPDAGKTRGGWRLPWERKH